MAEEEVEFELISKIKRLNELVWDGKLDIPHIDDWLDRFSDGPHGRAESRFHALYLLSNFLYISSEQVRECLKHMYEQCVEYPIVESIRRSCDDTTDVARLEHEYKRALRRTRFLGVGNPSESGVHLLYYFRQENRLSKDLFINTHEIFSRGSGSQRSVRDVTIDRYIFIDDFCGSGHQAEEYSEQIVQDIKQYAPKASVHYCVLFALADGLKFVKEHTGFDEVTCVGELDDTFRCFSETSRYFQNNGQPPDKSAVEDTCRYFGSKLWADHPLGYNGSQLLMGLFHNTPDNTLPIFWSHGDGVLQWAPPFKRYQKLGW